MRNPTVAIKIRLKETINRLKDVRIILDNQAEFNQCSKTIFRKLKSGNRLFEVEKQISVLGANIESLNLKM